MVSVVGGELHLQIFKLIHIIVLLGVNIDFYTDMKWTSEYLLFVEYHGICR